LNEVWGNVKKQKVIAENEHHYKGKKKREGRKFLYLKKDKERWRQLSRGKKRSPLSKGKSRGGGEGGGGDEGGT